MKEQQQRYHPFRGNIVIVVLLFCHSKFNEWMDEWERGIVWIFRALT